MAHQAGLRYAISASMGCPSIGRLLYDNWGLNDLTGKGDEGFRGVIIEIDLRVKALMGVGREIRHDSECFRDHVEGIMPTHVRGWLDPDRSFVVGWLSRLAPRVLMSMARSAIGPCCFLNFHSCSMRRKWGVVHLRRMLLLVCMDGWI